MDADKCLEEMARVVAMRGAQSYGFFAASRASMSTSKFVLRKRDDIATALSTRVARRRLPVPDEQDGS